MQIAQLSCYPGRNVIIRCVILYHKQILTQLYCAPSISSLFSGALLHGLTSIPVCISKMNYDHYADLPIGIEHIR